MSEAVVTRWWWIRHAPVPGQGGRIYGQTDVPADTSDTAAFQAIATALPRQAVWVTSHLRRTRQTAEAIAAALNQSGVAVPEPLAEPDLAEQNFGVWQGLSHHEVVALRGGVRHRFWLAPADQAPPEGESFTHLIARVSAAIRRLVEAHAGRDIIAVAHGGSIRAALAVALDLNPEAALAIEVNHLSLTRIDHIDGPGAGNAWRVGAVNLPLGNHPPS